MVFPASRTTPIRKPFRWKRDHSILFLKEVLAHEPYRFKKGSKERGDVWSKIANTLNQIPHSWFLNVTQRSVRTQYEKLMDEFVKKDKQELAASGIDAEYDELDQLLYDTFEKSTDATAELATQANKKQKIENEEKLIITDIRTQAMERMKEHPKQMKRKSTVLKEIIEKGRKAKNELEVKRMALEEKRLEAENERQEMFNHVVDQEQHQQSMLLEQQKQARELQQEFMRIQVENQKQQQGFYEQQQKMLTQMQVQNSQVQLELLRVLRDIQNGSGSKK
ncbi:interaptin-like [Dendronephthya gigantea]|uniref:interaptin-like n=1 Tax=Dendronephthya gigantea TaxID=151771 RepID=UPI0010696668|nr:interaptin-like [Dendronephthya gigantea]